MLTLYGITSCDSCRDARKWLEAHAIDYRYHDFRDDGTDRQSLERWAGRLGWEQLLNKRSLTWRKVPEVDRSEMTKGRALDAMQERPTLIKRPILEHRSFVAVGFSPDRYEALFKSEHDPE